MILNLQYTLLLLIPDILGGTAIENRHLQYTLLLLIQRY